MSKFPSFIELLVKQTCRRASHEFEMGSKHSSAPLPVTGERDATGIYSLEFLKSLHDKPRENIFKLIKTTDPNNPNSVKSPNNYTWLLSSKEFSIDEREKLLAFLHKVKDMSPARSKKWIDLHHHMHYVYRNFASVTPDPTAEVLSPFFVEEMKQLVKSLLEEDESQVYLRILALLREYCIFAQWNYSKSEGQEYLITKLFYYYEAMLSAAKNLSSVFSEFEVIIYRNYSVCWIDFNTCVFIRYFFETDYVQNKIYNCLETKNSPGDTPAMFGLLEDLKNLWIKEQKRIRKINDDHSLVEGTASYFIEEAMIGNYKKVLTSNFWVERSQQELNDLDLRRLDHHFFRLLGDPFFHPAGPILDRNGQCICEECLIAKYEFILMASNEDTVNDNILRSNNRMTYCRRCKKLIELNKFHHHINEHVTPEENNTLTNGVKNLSSIISEKINFVKLGSESEEYKIDQNYVTDDKSTKTKTKSLRNTCDIHYSKPQHDPSELHCTKLAFEEFLRLRREADKKSQSSNNTVRNFIKIKKDIYDSSDSSSSETTPYDNTTPLRRRTTVTRIPDKIEKECETVKNKEDIRKNLHKCDKARVPPCKSTVAKSSSEHTCRMSEERVACHGGVCDHQKEPKKCDCTYCEVFGSEKFPAVTSQTHKSNELRDRLRIRLHQRREKRTKDTCKNPPSSSNSNGTITANTTNATKIKTVISKVEERVPLPSSPTNIPPAPSIKSSDSSIATSSSGTDDIHGLVNYIEGTHNLNKMDLAEKKAAKKARQRQKKEEERIKAEEEQKRIEEEIRRKEAEKKKEMARKQAEKEKSKAAAEAAAAQALKELKKKSKKERQAEKRRQQKMSLEEKSKVVEETIPAMVTIKRIAESGSSAPTVTITLKGSTPDQDKLLYTLVNGADDANNKPRELENNDPSKNKKKKQKQPAPAPQLNQKPKVPVPPKVITKELKVTVAVDVNKSKEPGSISQASNVKPAKNGSVKTQSDKTKVTKPIQQKATVDQNDLPIPMLRLPPGITITKVEGPVTNRNYQVGNLEDQKGSTINVGKSGVIVVDTEKLIHQKQDPVQTKLSKNAKKKKKRNNKKLLDTNSASTSQNEVKKMVTLKNPIFQSFQQKPEPIVDRNAESCAPAAIFTNENGMVTIRSSRLQQSLTNGGKVGSELNPMPLSSISNLVSDIQKPMQNGSASLGLETKPEAISPFNAQEILSGLPGIEITKVDKKTVKPEAETSKINQTAQVSIIPTSNGGERFSLDKDDWLYDSVFSPRDVLEDDMDPEELELEAFKRFCQQSIQKRKEKVAHLNVADIVVNKKTDVNFV